MKRLTFSNLILFLITSIVLFAGANQSVQAADPLIVREGDGIFATSLADGGRLIIKPSPTLGYDIGVAITIDGQISGSVVRGPNHVRYVSPGRHVVVATPNRLGGEWRVILDVGRGQTYCYVASYSNRQARLEPARQCP